MTVQGPWCNEYTFWSVLSTFKWLVATTLRALWCRAIPCGTVPVSDTASSAAAAASTSRGCSRWGHFVCTWVVTALHQGPGCIRRVRTEPGRSALVESAVGACATTTSTSRAFTWWDVSQDTSWISHGTATAAEVSSGLIVGLVNEITCGGIWCCC